MLELVDADTFASLFETPHESPPRRRRERPAPGSGAPQTLAEHLSVKAAASGNGLKDVGGVQALMRPVTISLLATVFRMDPQTVTKRLARCPHLVHESSGRKVYDFAEAASYIVTPRMTTEEFVRTLNKANLPPEISLAFWNAQRAKIKYMLEAQEAWDTSEVLDVLGDVFMTIKDVLTTTVEDIRETAKLSDEQAKLLEQAIDELRATLRDKLVAMPLEKQTGSLVDRPLFGTSKDIDPTEDTWTVPEEDEA